MKQKKREKKVVNKIYPLGVKKKKKKNEEEPITQ